MSNELFQKLEEKINQLLDVVAMQAEQLDDAHDENRKLMSEISGLKYRQTQWEQSINKLLTKIDSADYLEHPETSGTQNEIQNESWKENPIDSRYEIQTDSRHEPIQASPPTDQNHQTQLELEDFDTEDDIYEMEEIEDIEDIDEFGDKKKVDDKEIIY